MTAYQRIFVLAISSGFVIGALVAFPSSQKIMQRTQSDRRNPHSSQMFMLDSSTQSYILMKVAGVIYNIDHEARQILIDSISPYPDGENTRMALTYGTSTTVTAMSSEFVQLPEVEISTLQRGDRIIAVLPRREGLLRVNRIFIQP